MLTVYDRYLDPTPNGQSSLSVSSLDTPVIGPGEGMAASFSVSVEGPARMAKRAPDDCTIAVFLDGTSVYNESVGTGNIVTDSVPLVSNPTLQVVETCGNDATHIVVYNASLVAAPLTPTSPSTTTTSSTSTTSTTSSSTSSLVTATPTNPAFVNNFTFYGCVASSNNFPSFLLAGTDGKMDIETCTNLCGTHAFAGVYET